jgi:hypothetical protein
VTLLQKMSSRVKSYGLPGQGIGPVLPTPHKQNPHTEINQPAVTAKILSQTDIQLFVLSVVVQSWQTDILDLHERLPCHVQHSVLI